MSAIAALADLPAPLSLGEHVVRFDAPVLMGIVNVTPDSFSDGGAFARVDTAVEHGNALVNQGAHIVDVGGESTRPGAESVSVQEECDRVLPVIEGLIGSQLDAVISIDTMKAEVAHHALNAGATLVNDVSALEDSAMGAVVAAAGAAIIVMHMRGNPRTMQSGDIVYDNVVADVASYLEQRLAQGTAAGIPRERMLVDPGIGFGKTLEHNMALTRDIGSVAPEGVAIVYGPSRKRFLGELTGESQAHQRDAATAAACMIAYNAGAHVFRVHNVAATRQALEVTRAFAAAES